MNRTGWSFRWVGPAAVVLTLAMALGAMLLAFPTSSHADVTAVKGSAYGYHAFNIALFGGAQPSTGPTPTVTLASDASNSPQQAAATQGEVVYGPATLFSSGQITVRTAGSLGEGGSVTTSTDVADVNRGGSEVLDADSVKSECTASEAGVSASTTVTNGTMRLHAQAEDHDEQVVTIPTNPEPGYTLEGHLHIGDAQDNFRYVFNEQVANPDGSITVNAVHAYLLGPTATGDLIIGQSVCGVSASGAPTTTTTVPSSTTTTVPSGSPTASPSPSPSPTGPQAPGQEGERVGCAAELEPAPFADRAAIPDTHLHNVDCLASLDIVRGFADGTYRPALQVRRDQMAWFIASSLQAAGVQLPPAAAERFSDVPAGSAHDDAIHRLAAAGIVHGGAGGAPADIFGPALRVRRDQVASFLIRAAQYATGQDLASQTQLFTDVPATNPHFPSVNGAAVEGLAQGYGDNTYRPGAVVRRDQMASFIVRLLDEVAENT